MARFKVGDTISLQGVQARVVWVNEDANEIEAIDEYIVEFADNHRQFAVSSELEPEQAPSGHKRERDSDPCHRQTYSSCDHMIQPFRP